MTQRSGKENISLAQRGETVNLVGRSNRQGKFQNVNDHEGELENREKEAEKSLHLQYQQKAELQAD